MDATCDVFLTNLPKSISEVVVKNLFSSAGKVLKVKIIDDKRNENQKLCFVGFRTMDEALEAVRIADRSDAFGDPIRASISKKCLDGMENNQNRSNNTRNDSSFKGSDSFSRKSESNFKDSEKYPSNNGDFAQVNRLNNVGRGRGIQNKIISGPPSFKTNEIKLNDIKLKTKELVDIEIVDLSRVDLILIRPVKPTENSKIEIADLLSQINSNQSNLVPVDCPKVGDFYLAKWTEDDCYYRAELLDILKEGSFKVTFVDEGTSGDIVTDLKHIPTGALQQYPKQFLKVSIGCSDVKELMSFIIHESEGKVIKIYWLGEYCDSIPVVNLFLNEDEIVEKYAQINKINIRKKLSHTFDDLPVHNLETSSHFSFVPSMYKNENEFILQMKNSSISLSHKKCPTVLPIPGDICIYEKRNSTGESFLRSVILRRQLFSFDIELIDIGEKIMNVNIDNLYTAEESHLKNAPCAITCDLDNSVNLDGDRLLQVLIDGVIFNLKKYKRNNKYTVSFNLPEKKVYEYAKVSYKDFIGKSFKVIMSHVVSPINFFIQLDDGDNQLALGDIQEKLNINYSGSAFKSVGDVNITQAVIAPFIVSGTDAELFRAYVLEKRKESPQIHVLFIDYGNDEWVNYETLLNVNEELITKPGFAIHCKLSLNIRKEAWSHANELFSDLAGYSENDQGAFVMQVIGVDGDTLVVDLISEMKGSLTAILEKSGTCVKLNEPTCNGGSPAVKLNGVINDKSQTAILENLSEGELYKKVLELERRLNALEISLKK
uniref:Tudor domain containing 1 n=1 Tax=Schmidtea polychroa TaxID=50054 RepID=C0L3L0_SCHPL|nr:tudor domain containing 1 [Schmidtea polychroa]